MYFEYWNLNKCNSNISIQIVDETEVFFQVSNFNIYNNLYYCLLLLNLHHAYIVKMTVLPIVGLFLKANVS